MGISGLPIILLWRPKFTPDRIVKCELNATFIVLFLNYDRFTSQVHLKIHKVRVAEASFSNSRDL